MNTARGEVVDNEALVELLKSKKIFAATVDVFEQELPPSNYPLLNLDNVVATPHIAYNTEEANKKMSEIAIKNVLEFYCGNPINVENREVEVLEKLKNENKK